MAKLHLIAAGLAFILVPAAATGVQAQSWTQVGMLNCTLAPSVGMIIGSRQRMSCTFVPSQPSPANPPQNYVGLMTTVGIDIGITTGGALAWAVFSPTTGPSFAGLAGTYVGASGDVTLGIGAGANVLLGGNARSIALQPLSVEGTTGLNIQLGASGLELTPAP